MSIIIGADIVPTESNFALFTEGKVEELVGKELTSVIRQANFRIFNLEVPLTEVARPITKCGPNLLAPCCTVNGLKALGVDLLTLANNHIMDQGLQGLNSTQKVLDAADIAYVGAGNSPAEAAEPYIFYNVGKAVGVYACAEHEFSIVTESQPGANPYEPLESFRHVENLKASCDYVVVLYHGGKEHYRYPSPNLQKICRRFVECGADLVVCQHSHCIGCEEKYQEGTIVYGQGNFIFDDSDHECWQTSLLIELDDGFNVSYLPLVKKGNCVRAADHNSCIKIMSAFQKRSGEIQKSGFIQNNYAAFAESYYTFYLRTLSGKQSFLVRLFDHMTRGAFLKSIIRFTYDTKNLVRIINFIECEAHRELLLTALKNAYLENGIDSI